MSRRPEIEAKRQRLAELRRAREEKERLSLAPESQQLSVTPPVDVPLSRESIDSLVNGLVGEKEKEVKMREIATQTVVDVRMYDKSTQTVVEEPMEEKKAEENANEVEEIIEDAHDEVQDDVVEIQSIDDTQLSSFLAKSFRILNRAIEDDQDILTQYTLHKSITTDDPQPYILKHQLSQQGVITSIDSSPFFPQLIAFASGKCIWVYNSRSGKYESKFEAHTRIMNVQFSQFQTNMVIGAGYNGKIHQWDLESTSSLPFLTSRVSQDTHSYPVLAIDQVHENDGVVITASTDGKLVHWHPQILAKPSQTVIQMMLPKSLALRYDELTPTCITHLQSEHGFVIVGSEDGRIYKVKRFDQRAKAEYVDKWFTGHTGPVTGIQASTEWPGLFISSSMDWRLYLWDVSKETPLLDVYKSNAIMGCSWRPGKPTQLAYIYEDFFELLDLSVDSVIPVCKLKTPEQLTSFGFSKEGDIVILGGVTGGVFVYELDINVKSDLSKFKRIYIAN